MVSTLKSLAGRQIANKTGGMLGGGDQSSSGSNMFQATPYNQPSVGPPQQSQGFSLQNYYNPPNQNAGFYENMMGGSNRFGKMADLAKRNKGTGGRQIADDILSQMLRRR